MGGPPHPSLNGPLTPLGHGRGWQHVPELAFPGGMHSSPVGHVTQVMFPPHPSSIGRQDGALTPLQVSGLQQVPSWQTSGDEHGSHVFVCPEHGSL